MDHYQATGAGSPLTFLDDTDTNIDDYPLSQSAYFDGQHIMQPHPISFGHGPTGKLFKTGTDMLLTVM
jgi:hypothetical protein